VILADVTVLIYAFRQNVSNRKGPDTTGVWSAALAIPGLRLDYV
jgi:hypothetical protein